MITLLQHTHLSLPHYTGTEWDWLRGALCTVDRSFGALLNVLHHHIADTHVAHHLFSQARVYAIPPALHVGACSYVSNLTRPSAGQAPGIMGVSILIIISLRTLLGKPRSLEYKL